MPVVLEAGPCSLDQRHPATGALLATYAYKDVEAVVPVSDYPGGFIVICGRFGRMVSGGRELGGGGGGGLARLWAMVRRWVCWVRDLC